MWNDVDALLMNPINFFVENADYYLDELEKLDEDEDDNWLPVLVECDVIDLY